MRLYIFVLHPEYGLIWNRLLYIVTMFVAVVVRSLGQREYSLYSLITGPKCIEMWIDLVLMILYCCSPDLSLFDA